MTATLSVPEKPVICKRKTQQGHLDPSRPLNSPESGIVKIRGVQGGKQYHCKKCFDNRNLPRECDTCKISADKAKFNIVLKNGDIKEKKYYCNLECYKKGNSSNLPIITDIMDKSDIDSIFETVRKTLDNDSLVENHLKKSMENVKSLTLEKYIHNYDTCGDIGYLQEIQGIREVYPDGFDLKSDSPPTLVLVFSVKDPDSMHKFYTLNKLALSLKDKKTAPIIGMIHADLDDSFKNSNLLGKILFYFDEVACEEFEGDWDIESLRKFVKNCMKQPYEGVIEYLEKKYSENIRNIKNKLAIK